MSTEKTYYGYVLYCGEINGYNDSDFYAIVWDDETQSVKRIDDGTTRFAAPPRYLKADAPAEIVAKARQYQISGPLQKDAWRSIMNERLEVRFGDKVRVVRGRKVAKGEYEVFGVYVNKFYRESRYGNALGIRMFDPKKFNVGLRDLAGNRYFTSLANVEKDVVEPTAEEVQARAEQLFTGFHGGAWTSLGHAFGRVHAYEEKKAKVAA